MATKSQYGPPGFWMGTGEIRIEPKQADIQIHTDPYPQQGRFPHAMGITVKAPKAFILF